MTESTPDAPYVEYGKRWVKDYDEGYLVTRPVWTELWDRALEQYGIAGMPGDAPVAFRDPAPLTSTDLGPYIEQINHLMKEIAMTNSPLTTRGALQTLAWRGTASQLSQQDVGRVVKATTTSGIEVKAILDGLYINGEDIRVAFRDLPTYDANYLAHRYPQLDPKSKVSSFDLYLPEVSS